MKVKPITRTLWVVLALSMLGTPLSLQAKESTPLLIQQSTPAKKLIGAKARISFTELGFDNIKAKVDTGAFTSSLHCTHVAIDPSKKWVEFTPLTSKKSFRMPISRISDVTSSNGTTQIRAFVMLHVKINGITYEAEFSLSNRQLMEFPVLIGKQLLHGNFIVDVAL